MAIGIYDNSGCLLSAMSGMTVFLRENDIPWKSYNELPVDPTSNVEEVFLVNPHPNSNFDIVRNCALAHPQTKFYMITPVGFIMSEVREKMGEVNNVEYITIRDTDRMAEILGAERKTAEATA